MTQQVKLSRGGGWMFLDMFELMVNVFLKKQKLRYYNNYKFKLSITCTYSNKDQLVAKNTSVYTF